MPTKSATPLDSRPILPSLQALQHRGYDSTSKMAAVNPNLNELRCASRFGCSIEKKADINQWLKKTKQMKKNVSKFHIFIAAGNHAGETWPQTELEAESHIFWTANEAAKGVRVAALQRLGLLPLRSFAGRRVTRFLFSARFLSRKSPRVQTFQLGRSQAIHFDVFLSQTLVLRKRGASSALETNVFLNWEWV